MKTISSRPESRTNKLQHERTADNGSRPLNGTNTVVNEGTVSILQVLVRRDQYAIRDRLRLERSLSCFVNQFMSPPGLPKDEFKKAMKKSDVHVKLYRTTGDPGELPVEILADISDSLQCLLVIEERQKAIQKQIEAHAQKLPIWTWWKEQPGLGAKGLGLIVGHAGNIGTFNKAAGLWQRMGLRNVNFLACSTHAREKSLSAEEWVKIGYARKRRSVMFTIVDSLLRKQRSVKDKELKPPGRWVAAGEYGKLAIERYTEALRTHDDWTPIHRELDVNRVVGKRLLSDLLKVWKA